MYFANFNVNNGTSLKQGISSTDFLSIVKTIKKYANGEIFLNGKGKITIWEEVPVNEEGITTTREVAQYEARWYKGKLRWKLM